MKISAILLFLSCLCHWAVSQSFDLQLKKVNTGIKCPFKSLSFSRQLPTKKNVFFGADLLLGKNSEGLTPYMQNLIKTYHITTPLYAGYQLSEDYFVEAGPYFSLLANRRVDNPFEYTGTQPDAMEMGIDGGFSAAIGCKIGERGNLKMRYNLGVTTFQSDFKFLEHANTRRLEVGLNLKL